MNTQLRRRLFLGSIVGAGVAATAVGFAVLPLSPELRLKQLLRSRLSYLTFSDDVVDAFMRDFSADSPDRFAHLRSTAYVGQKALYSQDLVTSGLPIFRFERFVISAFLLSTDFFRRGAQTDTPLRYVAYNDPYKVGCANPFARI